jgi:hypothetical protein
LPSSLSLRARSSVSGSGITQGSPRIIVLDVIVSAGLTSPSRKSLNPKTRLSASHLVDAP